MLKIALAAAAASAALGVSAARATASSEEVTAVRVNYADLDVASPVGARALMQRIAKAASRACGGAPFSLLHDDAVRFDRCRTDAYGRAVIRLAPTILDAVTDAPARTLVADRR